MVSKSTETKGLNLITAAIDICAHIIDHRLRFINDERLLTFVQAQPRREVYVQALKQLEDNVNTFIKFGIPQTLALQAIALICAPYLQEFIGVPYGRSYVFDSQLLANIAKRALKLYVFHIASYFTANSDDTAYNHADVVAKTQDMFLNIVTTNRRNSGLSTENVDISTIDVPRCCTELRVLTNLGIYKTTGGGHLFHPFQMESWGFQRTDNPIQLEYDGFAERDDPFWRFNLSELSPIRAPFDGLSYKDIPNTLQSWQKAYYQQTASVKDLVSRLFGNTWPKSPTPFFLRSPQAGYGEVWSSKCGWNTSSTKVSLLLACVYDMCSNEYRSEKIFFTDSAQRARTIAIVGMNQNGRLADDHPAALRFLPLPKYLFKPLLPTVFHMARVPNIETSRGSQQRDEEANSQ